jgi:hypothetical protein
MAEQKEFDFGVVSCIVKFHSKNALDAIDVGMLFSLTT